MIENLESSYDCANAGLDLHQLKEELQDLRISTASDSTEDKEKVNRIENQISFIENKCSIHNGQH
ncbi:hypothetical protein [Paenibacillus sp. FJAT-26967]|uniref:hypothetical protein n=1 Tax=Paenibacillus sp. FJAT-26967 TaxID=1729690 RepID=UPI000837AE5A|nr:hypothetical protein [Paenibacillus sp. FJAT-26967]